MEKSKHSSTEMPYEGDPNPKGKDDKGHNGSNGNHGEPIKPPRPHSLICSRK